MESNNPIQILAIETSCDETAASLVVENDGKPEVISNIVSSQIDLHTKTGGVVPEVASRAHIESILPVIDEALTGSKLEEITHIAVTAGPGLIGSLMVGFDSAKSLAYGLDLPIVPINHIEGHIYSALTQDLNSKPQTLNSKQIQNKNDQNSKQFKELDNSNLDIVSDLEFGSSEFPLIALTASGGHTSLTLMQNHGEYQTIGETLDDAAGEAFDKVARLLGLGYPGGPIVSKLAEQYRNKNIKRQNTPRLQSGQANSKQISNSESQIQKDQGKSVKEISDGGFRLTFPRPMLSRPSFDFSFSGLKTAVLTEVKKRTANGERLTANEKKEICFAFEEATVDVLVAKTLKAAKKYKPKAVILAGGVSANKRLREVISKAMVENGFKLMLPPKDMTGDNASMIGLAAYYHIVRDELSSWDKIELDSNMKL